MGSGWITAWNAELASDTATLRNSLHCDSTFQTWTDATGSNENLPINCVTWFEAFAFCVWDGGRFPTEAEWNYAAAGGNEQREFPWGAMVDSTKASYLCIADGSSPQDCSAKDILAVGARPAGNAKWGHTDLAGNMWEWVLDKSASYTLPCNDCANLANGSDRIARGGSFGETEGNITSGVRFAELPGNRFPTIGFRCARD
jgi:formylglycine-generating enzyme required for sulfatase activity